jgi:hypothetical protein
MKRRSPSAFISKAGIRHERAYNPAQRGHIKAVAPSPTRKVDYADNRRQERRNIARQKILSCSQAELITMFSSLDENNDGNVSYKELQNGLARIGLAVLVEDGNHLFPEIDKNGNGKISFEELQAFFAKDHKMEKQKHIAKMQRKASYLYADVNSHSTGVLPNVKHNIGGTIGQARLTGLIKGARQKVRVSRRWVVRCICLCELCVHCMCCLC